MRRILSAVTLVLLAACSDSTGPTTGVRVQTEWRTYQLGGQEVLPVPFTVTNTSDAGVELLACGGTPVIELQSREEWRWTTIAGTICPANLVTTPIELAPGASVTGEVQIYNVGTFRIVLPNPSLDAREPRAISPTFEVWWQLID